MGTARTVQIVSLVIAASAASAALAAQADPMSQILKRNAAQQTRIHDALASDRLDPLRAAQIQQRAAEVYRQQAEAVTTNPGSAEQEQLRQAQRDLAGAIAWAEKNPARNKGSQIDRTRQQVASMRDAEQQRMIAHGYAQGRLTAEQVATLQEAQSKIAAAQSDAISGGESLEEARAIQGAQNLQDYSIREDPSIASVVAQEPDGHELARAGSSN